MEKMERLTVGSYFRILTEILGRPRKFFGDLPAELGWKHPLAFLCVSSLFFVGASLVSHSGQNAFRVGAVLFVNAMGMVFITSGIGYMVMTMTMGKRVTFARFFGVYAFAWGITLLVSWVAYFVWLTEPWKWWLIWTGMTRGWGFKRTQAALVIGVSLVVVVLFFLSALPGGLLF